MTQFRYVLGMSYVFYGGHTQDIILDMQVRYVLGTSKVVCSGYILGIQILFQK